MVSNTEEKTYPVKDLLNIEGNHLCFDCGVDKVTWANASCGVFLCMECALNHKDFFDNTHSHIKSIESPHWKQYDYVIMRIGGNDSLGNFLKFYEIEVLTKDLNKKYMNKALAYYIQLLKSQAEGTEFSEKRPSKEEGVIPIEKPKDFKQRMSAMYQNGVDITKKIGADLNKDYQKSKEAIKEQLSYSKTVVTEKGSQIKDGVYSVGKNVADSVSSTFGKISSYFSGNKEGEQNADSTQPQSEGEKPSEGDNK